MQSTRWNEICVSCVAGSISCDASVWQGINRLKCTVCSSSVYGILRSANTVESHRLADVKSLFVFWSEYSERCKLC